MLQTFKNADFLKKTFQKGIDKLKQMQYNKIVLKEYIKKYLIAERQKGRVFMNNTRTNNCINGSITFDGVTVFRDGKPIEAFENIVSFIAEKLKTEKLIISFYRDNTVYFKLVGRADFLTNPEVYLYFNGNSDAYEFGFRFQSKYAGILLELPDALDKNGEKLEMLEADFCAKYNNLIESRATSKYGFIAEYHISGNPADLHAREKAHDVWTKYTTKNGTVSKYCISCEVKASYAGAKGTHFIAYSKDKGIIPMSSGYKKSNALFRAEII